MLCSGASALSGSSEHELLTQSGCEKENPWIRNHVDSNGLVRSPKDLWERFFSFINPTPSTYQYIEELPLPVRRGGAMLSSLWKLKGWGQHRDSQTPFKSLLTPPLRERSCKRSSSRVQLWNHRFGEVSQPQIGGTTLKIVPFAENEC